MERSLCWHGSRFWGRSEFGADKREGTASPSTSVLHPSALTFHNPYSVAPFSSRCSRPVRASSCAADIPVVLSPCPFLRVSGCSVLFRLLSSAASLLPPLPWTWRDHRLCPGLTILSFGFAQCVTREDQTPFRGQYRKGHSRSYSSVAGLRGRFPAIAVLRLPCALSVVCSSHMRMDGRGLRSDARPGAGGHERSPVLQSPQPGWSFPRDAVADPWSRALVANELASKMGPWRGRGFFTARYGIFHGAQVWPASCLM